MTAMARPALAPVLRPAAALDVRVDEEEAESAVLEGVEAAVFEPLDEVDAVAEASPLVDEDGLSDLVEVVCEDCAFLVVVVAAAALSMTATASASATGALAPTILSKENTSSSSQQSVPQQKVGVHRMPLQEHFVRDTGSSPSIQGQVSLHTSIKDIR